MYSRDKPLDLLQANLSVPPRGLIDAGSWPDAEGFEEDFNMIRRANAIPLSAAVYRFGNGSLFGVTPRLGSRDVRPECTARPPIGISKLAFRGGINGCFTDLNVFFLFPVPSGSLQSINNMRHVAAASLLCIV